MDERQAIHKGDVVRIDNPWWSTKHRSIKCVALVVYEDGALLVSPLEGNPHIRMVRARGDMTIAKDTR